MKVKAHLIVHKDYNTAIAASQWINGLIKECEEYNSDQFNEDYRSHDKIRAVITVEFEVPDSVFKREPIFETDGDIIQQT